MTDQCCSVLLPVLGGMTTPNPFPIVGVIGLGKMGSAFARNLLAGGEPTLCMFAEMLHANETEYDCQGI
eukprot:10117-Eustigmatos_ZCMA.PRE.1